MQFRSKRAKWAGLTDRFCEFLLLFWKYCEHLWSFGMLLNVIKKLIHAKSEIFTLFRIVSFKHVKV
jgi:hypothetical protein